MKRLHVVGRKNHGKTTLIVELIEELTRRGLRLGTVKHTSHVHELDTPGKDSHRQRTAGASPAAVVTPDTVAVFVAQPRDDNVYRRLAPMFRDCDLVLVEGDLDTQALKVEVWRAALGTPCLASGRSDLVAVITDDQVDVELPVWARDDIATLADHVLSLVASATPAP